MKKLILIICLLGFFKFSYSQQKDSAFFVGINVAPIIISTQINIFAEKSINPYLTFHASIGYVINGPGSWIKLGTYKELDKSSGGFISLGLNGHLNNKRVSPLIGIRIINSYSYEEGFDRIDVIKPFTSTGYSLGIGGLIGISCKILNQLSIDLGIQKSYLLINGLCDFHSFAPGMGINYDPLKGQFITQIKYKFGK